jgi:outer membrane biosynthesis protein TonB
MPIDPYANSLDNEVDLQMTRSQPAFRHCADTSGPVHGDIQIAFQVAPDGRTTHVAAVSDSTGSTALTSCLIAAIQQWSFAVHPSVSIDFMRPFSYP